jgi:hypothetical protein
MMGIGLAEMIILGLICILPVAAGIVALAVATTKKKDSNND